MVIAQQAVRAAGGCVRVAKLVGLTKQAVSAWRRVPPEHCRVVAAATKGKFSVHDLRPDVFGPALDRDAA